MGEGKKKKKKEKKNLTCACLFGCYNYLLLMVQDPVQICITLPPAKTAEFTMGKLLVIQRRIAITVGLGHLSLIAEESTEEFYYFRSWVMEDKNNPKPGILVLRFDREVARNSAGILDFHSFAQTLFSFAEVWIQLEDFVLGMGMRLFISLRSSFVSTVLAHKSM